VTRLMELVYPELHRIAARHLRGERRGHTLQPTAVSRPSGYAGHPAPGRPIRGVTSTRPGRPG
jgi:hypothetical protein